MSLRCKAVVAREIGAPPVVEQVEVEAPRHGEVSIRLAACGVCHSDLSATNGTIAYPLPLVLGHEGAGTVTSPCCGSATSICSTRTGLPISRARTAFAN